MEKRRNKKILHLILCFNIRLQSKLTVYYVAYLFLYILADLNILITLSTNCSGTVQMYLN